MLLCFLQSMEDAKFEAFSHTSILKHVPFKFLNFCAKMNDALTLDTNAKKTTIITLKPLKSKTKENPIRF